MNRNISNKASQNQPNQPRRMVKAENRDPQRSLSSKTPRTSSPEVVKNLKGAWATKEQSGVKVVEKPSITSKPLEERELNIPQKQSRDVQPP
jgi:hypothetical protein